MEAVLVAAKVLFATLGRSAVKATALIRITMMKIVESAE